MKDQASSRRRRRVSRYAPFLLWIGVIFFLSSPEASFDETSRIIGPLLQFFFPGFSEETRQIIHGYIRKCAHFTEYAILAFLAFRAFSMSSVALFRRSRYFFPLIAVLIIASMDEFNQSFEASRTASVWDVLLDLSGGLAMMLFLFALHRRLKAQ